MIRNTPKSSRFTKRFNADIEADVTECFPKHQLGIPERGPAMDKVSLECMGLHVSAFSSISFLGTYGYVAIDIQHNCAWLKPDLFG